MPNLSARRRAIAFTPRLRTVDPLRVAQVFADSVNLSRSRAHLAVRTAWYPNEPPAFVPFVDADGWLACSLAALPLFATTLPKITLARETAARSMLVITLARTGNNLSEAARVLDHSRKVLRDNLKRHGLYPIPDIAEDLLLNKRIKSGNIVTVFAGATVASLHALMSMASADDRVTLEKAAAVAERMGREGNGK